MFVQFAQIYCFVNISIIYFIKFCIVLYNVEHVQVLDSVISRMSNYLIDVVITTRKYYLSIYNIFYYTWYNYIMLCSPMRDHTGKIFKTCYNMDVNNIFSCKIFHFLLMNAFISLIVILGTKNRDDYDIEHI